MEKLIVETPAGQLIAKPSDNANYPGIWVSLNQDDFMLVDFDGVSIKTHIWDQGCNQESKIQYVLRPCDCCNDINPESNLAKSIRVDITMRNDQENKGLTPEQIEVIIEKLINDDHIWQQFSEVLIKEADKISKELNPNGH